MDFNKMGQKQGDYDFELINRSKKAEKELILTFKINELLSEREYLIKKVTELELKHKGCNESFEKPDFDASEYEIKISDLEKENEKLKYIATINEEKAKLFDQQKEKIKEIINFYNESIVNSQVALDDAKKLLSEIECYDRIVDEDNDKNDIKYGEPLFDMPDIETFTTNIPEISNENTETEDFYPETEEFHLHPEDIIAEKESMTIDYFNDIKIEPAEEKTTEEIIKAEEPKKEEKSNVISDNEKAYYKRAVNIADILEKYSK